MRLRSLLTAAAIACLIFTAGPVSAGEQTYIDGRVSQMEDELDLTPEQSARVRQIVEETLAQIAVDREQLQDDPRALQDAAGRALRNADKQIDEILSEEQREKFVDFRKTGRADIITLDLEQKLGLTGPQTAEIYEILFEAEQELVEMRDEMRNSGGGRGGRGGGGMSKMRDIMEDTDKKIEKVLTDEQKEIYQEIVAERRAQMRERMGGPGGGRGGRGGGGGGGGRGRP